MIAAVNGFAMGGGCMLVEHADLRIAAKDAVFEASEAKRWLLGGYHHGLKNGLPHAVGTIMTTAYLGAKQQSESGGRPRRALCELKR